MGAADGNVLYLGEILLADPPRRGKNAVAEDKGLAAVHAVMPADAVDGLLHPRDLGSVFQKNVAGLHGHLHDFTLIFHFSTSWG